MTKEEKLKVTLEEPNMGRIKLEYSKHLILPHKDMLKVMDALSHAELFDIDYNGNFVKSYTTFKDYFECTIIPKEEYYQQKTKLLLGVINE